MEQKTNYIDPNNNQLPGFLKEQAAKKTYTKHLKELTLSFIVTFLIIISIFGLIYLVSPNQQQASSKQLETSVLGAEK